MIGGREKGRGMEYHNLWGYELYRKGEHEERSLSHNVESNMLRSYISFDHSS